MQISPKVKAIIREYVESILIALVLALFVRTFIIQAFKIPSGSMIPTLQIGDRILVNKFIYGAKLPFSDKHLPGFTDPKRGDIIVFEYPEDKKKDFIKRLIAFGGETVEIRDGDIYIDGALVEDPIIKKLFYYNRGDFVNGFSYKVPDDHLFVLGDNSGSSRDSRYWGSLDEKLLLGKALVIYWPPKRMVFGFEI